MSASGSVEQHHFYDQFLHHVQNTGNRFWDWANRHTRGYITYLAQALKNFINKGVPESVIFGYWSVFSLFPLVMLAVVIATFALGAENARELVFNTLGRFIPGASSTLISENIVQSIQQRGGFGFFGIVGLLYGAVGLFTNLQWNLSRIFRDKEQRPLPAQMLIGLMMIIVLAFLITTSIIASVLFNLIGSQIVGQQSILMRLGASLLPLALNVIMFGLLFRFVPQRNISARALLPAALFAGIAWEISKNLFGWYAQNLANFGVVYGSLGTVMALLTWTYLTGCFVSLCAEVAVATDDWLAKRPPAAVVTGKEVNKPVTELSPEEREKAAVKNLK